MKPLFLFCLLLSSSTYSSKALNLVQEAKRAQSIEQAIVIFEKVIQEESFRRLDAHMRLEILMNLSQGYQTTEEFSKQEELLKKLLVDWNYSTFRVTLHVHLAQVFLDQGRLQE